MGLSENSTKKCPTQFPKAESDLFKYLVVSDQQSTKENLAVGLES